MSQLPNDLNVIHAAQLARITDTGAPRRGAEQDELQLLPDGAVAIRDGSIVGVGPTESVLREWGDGAPTIDATGCTVLPGLIECHTHPLFAGDRHGEYTMRMAGASLLEITAKGGGVMATIEATRAASDDELLDGLRRAYERMVAGGATTVEAKSGYGLTEDTELRQLRLLDQSRDLTPLSVVVSFHGAHVVPPGLDAETYTADVLNMLSAVCAAGLASFHDITCDFEFFPRPQVAALFERSRELGIPTRTHADAWHASEGWRTSVAAGAISAEHLTCTPDEEIRDVGSTDTIAVLLPQVELSYGTPRRANARLFIEQQVPVAVATNYCSSLLATSISTTVGIASPWFRLTPAEAIVGATINAAYALGVAADRGSLDIGKRGDLTILSVPDPEDLCVAVGQNVVSEVVIAGQPVLSGSRDRVGA
jgi:imidazolonepropionase